MAEISIQDPITLQIDITDWNSYPPSLETWICIELKPNLTGTFNLQLERIWFDCTQWDEFTTSLLAGRQAVLTDLNNAIELVVTRASQGAELGINYKKNYRADYETSILLRIGLDQDALSILEGQFKNIPKWW